MAVTVNISGADEGTAKFVKKMDQWGKLAGKSATDGVVFGSILLVQSLSAGTKVGKKYRRTVKNPYASHEGRQQIGAFLATRKSEKNKRMSRSVRKDRANPFKSFTEPKKAIEILKSRDRVFYIPTHEPRSHPSRQIKTRGLAKKSWFLQLRALGSSKNAGKVASVNAKGTVKVRKKLGGKDPTISAINKLSYISQMHPQLMSVAMEKATNNMEFQINQQLKKASKGKR